jgi:thiosulfate dehydrogenase [quinone] large subunit
MDGGSRDGSASTVETVSRRDRGQRRARGNPATGVELPPPPVARVSDTPGPSLWEQVERASPAARALLPIRAFFGITFIYAGFDKLLDPAFFDAANPGSIVSQLHEFTRVSPLAPVIRLTEPFAIPIGLLIALAEIAIGLGALTGLAFRVAAAGGAALSLTFWLTASWTTKPYYYGPDLPYAIGWIALLIGGHGNLLVPRFVRELGNPPMDDWDRSRAGGARGGTRPRGLVPEPEASPGRRLLLQAGVLGAVSLAVASLAVPLRMFRGSDAGAGTAAGNGAGGAGGAGGGAATLQPSGGPAGSPTNHSPAATAGQPTPAQPASTPFKPNGLAVTTTAAVDAKGAVRIVVPTNAPGSLPAGDPGLVVKLSNGGYAAYDAVCTHQGCTVGWDGRDGVMLCPCHGAAFDPNDHGAVLGGPTNTPLLELPLVVDQQAGTISLRV